MTAGPSKGQEYGPTDRDVVGAPVIGVQNLNQPAKAGADMHSNSQLAMRVSLAAGMKAIELNAIKQQKELAQAAEAQEES